jgi:hypothetical protein
MIQFAMNGRRLVVGSATQLTVFEVGLSDEPQWLESTSFALNSQRGGEHFSVTDDGRFVAAQSRTSLIQVWEILEASHSDNTTKTRSQTLGDSVYVLCDKNLSSIKLTQVGTNLYLIVGCESYLSDRGRVFTYEMHLEVSYEDDSHHQFAWKTFLPSLKGRNIGDRFGHSIAVVKAPNKDTNRVFRLAIGSPGYHNGQGMAQVFIASKDKKGWSQQGGDMTGRLIGEEFGTSVDMSSGEMSFVLVGSPHWKMPHEINDIKTEECGERGIVRLFHWRSERLGSPKRWTTVDDTTMIGSDLGDRFGSTVSITRNGDRVAAAAGGSDYAKIYSRQSYNSIDDTNIGVVVAPSSIIDGLQSFAMNDSGAMVAVVSSDNRNGGGITSFLDPSPFCQVPGMASNSSDFESFIDRQTCRFKDKLIANQEECYDTTLFGEHIQACSWKMLSISTSPSHTPSDPPSTSPSRRPTEFPISFPSFGPTVSSGNPTRARTPHPTSVSPSITFSEEPTYGPSSVPSGTTDDIPSGSLSGTPTLLPSSIASTVDPTIVGSFSPTKKNYANSLPSHSPFEESFSPMFEDLHLKRSTAAPTSEKGDSSEFAAGVILSAVVLTTLFGMCMLFRWRKRNANRHFQDQTQS